MTFSFLFKKTKRYVVDIDDPVIIFLSRKSKTRITLSKEYGFSVRTLNRRFERYGLNIPQGLICPHDLRIIYATLGIPENIKGIESNIVS